MDKVTPIYELPEVQEKVAKVRSFINIYLLRTNLYGWRLFIDDLKVDIEQEIYKYEELHRQGRYKETGAGAYCNMATQGAKNWAAYYAAQKRRALTDAVSLEGMTETEKGSIPYQFAAPDDSIAQMDILISIEQQFGAKIRKLAEAVLKGEQLSRAELKQLRLPEMKKLLSDVL